MILQIQKLGGGQLLFDSFSSEATAPSSCVFSIVSWSLAAQVGRMSLLQFLVSPNELKICRSEFGSRCKRRLVRGV